MNAFASSGCVDLAETATIVSIVVIVGAIVVLAWRHRPAAADAGRWGEPPSTAGTDGNATDGPADGEEDETGDDEPEAGVDDGGAELHDAQPDAEPGADADAEPGADARRS